MSIQSKQANIFFANNCTIADAASVSTGAVLIKETADGTVYCLDDKGDVIISQAAADQLRTFKLTQQVGGSEIRTGNIDPATLTFLTGQRAQIYKGDRLIIGAVENITAADAPLTVLPDSTYTVQINIISGADPVTKQRNYTIAGRSGSTGQIKAELLLELASSSGKNAEFNKLFRCLAVSDAANTGTISVTATYGKAQIAYTGGTLLVGDVIAYRGATMDGRVEPRGVYRVESVNAVTGTATLNQYWGSASITATAVDLIALADTDNWGLFVEAKAYLHTGYEGNLEYIEPLVEYATTEFAHQEIYRAGAEITGCRSVGHYLNVKHMVENNDEFLTGGYPSVPVAKNYYYSKVTLIADSVSNSRTQVTPVQIFSTIFIKCATAAELIAGTAVTYNNNIYTAPGIVPGAQGGLINTLNAIAIKNNVLRNAANTINNGGGYLTKDIDF